MDTLYHQFGQLVTQARTRINISQTELGKKCDIGRATIANIEAGKQAVSLDQAYRICLALDEQLVNLLPPLSLALCDRALQQVDKQVDQMSSHDLTAIKALLVTL